MTQSTSAIAEASAWLARVPRSEREEAWPEERLRLLRDTLARGATPQQLALIAQVAGAMGLNPFAGHLHAVVRQGQLSLQIGVDGLRLIALRSGAYRGQEGPLWCGRDGVWADVWLGEGPPAAAKVGVHREGFAGPVWAVCLLSEFRGPSGLWREKPAHMLAVRAETHALRRAFQQEIAGAERVALDRGVAVTVSPVGGEEEAPEPDRPVAVDEETGELLLEGPEAGGERLVLSPKEALAWYREASRRAREVGVPHKAPGRDASPGELTDAATELLDRVEEALRERPAPATQP